MFQLIVAVISIALVAALAIASIYYGGEAFTKSSLRAQVTTLVNGGQQIAGAVSLYNTDFPGSLTTGAATGTSGKLPVSYLSAEPGHTPFSTAAWQINTTAKAATIAINGTAEICAEVVRQAGSADGQFKCTAADGIATGTAAFAFKL